MIHTIPQPLLRVTVSGRASREGRVCWDSRRVGMWDHSAHAQPLTHLSHTEGSPTLSHPRHSGVMDPFHKPSPSNRFVPGSPHPPDLTPHTSQTDGPIPPPRGETLRMGWSVPTHLTAANSAPGKGKGRGKGRDQASFYCRPPPPLPPWVGEEEWWCWVPRVQLPLTRGVSSRASPLRKLLKKCLTPLFDPYFCVGPTMGPPPLPEE